MRALITGASSGIGYAAAQALHECGWDIDGIARGFDQADCGFMQTHEIDLAKVDALPAELDAIQVRPDCLILNAGKGLFGGLEQFSYSQMKQAVDLNLMSNLILLKHYLPALKKAGNKDIVLVGSEAALQGAKQATVYSATKFALRGLAQSLRVDCVAAGIRVMLVNPGPTATDFFNDLHFEPTQGEQYALDARDVAAAIVHALQMPRHVVQEEIVLQPMKRAFVSRTKK